jgi:23S rRNA (uracil1939-C5)-methyltransferase
VPVPDTFAEEVVLERFVAGGDALGRLGDGRVVFVRGGMPGERIRLDRVDAKRDFVRSVAHTVLEPSLARVGEPCATRRAGCGGCDWQHVDSSQQLPEKVSVVREAFTRVGRIEHPWVLPGGSVPFWGYRTTVRLGADRSGRLGIREERSHRVVPTSHCPVTHDRLNTLIAAELRVDGPGEVSLRVSTSHDMATASMAQRSQLRGPAEVLALGAVGVRVSAGAFFQSGPAAALLLIDRVRAAAGDALGAARTIDAFGGIGLFTAAYSLEGAVVVESSAVACRDAVHNLRGLGARVVEARWEDWSALPAGLVIADPARAGLGRRGAEVAAATGAERIVVVSCDPVSGARDGALLGELGYSPAGASVVDLFPQTHHVEVVARYDRGSVKEFELW